MAGVTLPQTRALDASLSPLRRELISLLCCPEDRGALDGWDGRAETGALVCVSCGRSYPIHNGIPCLLPDGLREEHEVADTDQSEIAEKTREMHARDAQVVSYDRMLGLKLFTSVEVPRTLGYLSPTTEHLVLEGGCGTGRMTPAFVDNARGLIALDFSAESVRVARAKLTDAQREKTLFIQADLSKTPLRDVVFDRVGSFGVYEHIPTPEARHRAMGEMARVLKSAADGGRFAFSAYRWGPPQSWMSEKEGHHEPGHIYFFRFTRAEVRAEAELYFDVAEQTEALLYYHLVRGQKKAA